MNKRALLILSSLLFQVITLFSQNFDKVILNPDGATELQLRGDITFIGNNILNRNLAKTTKTLFRKRSNTNSYFYVGTHYTNNYGGADLYDNRAYQEYTNNDLPNQDYYNPDILYTRRIIYDEWDGVYYYSYREASNADFYMDFIDVDGSNETFSSSSSTLNILQANCSEIAYVGLYWAGIFPYEEFLSNNLVSSQGRPFNTMKLKTPWSSEYKTFEADRIIRSITNKNDAEGRKRYVCYKDITDEFFTDGKARKKPRTNFNGEYTGADIHGTIGEDRFYRKNSEGDRISGGLGSSAGWTMVIIYKNPNKPAQHFAVFDGFTDVQVARGTSEKVEIEGFKTIPNGNVNVQLLTAALEGDASIKGDKFQILPNRYENRSTINPAWYEDISNSLNPNDNFFNGSITRYDQYLPGRNPSSSNTLGFDVDLFFLNNTNNRLITNEDEKAVFNFTTKQDSYWPFLNAFAVEIIAPDIRLVKTINNNPPGDYGNNDMANKTVDPGSAIFYDICFESVGTDNAINTKLYDYLPKNVNLKTTTIGGIAPKYIDGVPNTAGVRYPIKFENSDLIDVSSGDAVASDKVKFIEYEKPKPGTGNRGVVRFKIGNDLVRRLERGATPVQYCMRMQVEVIENCDEFRDLCSNRVDNRAYATYKGEQAVEFDNSKDPKGSFSNFDTCSNSAASASNFLVNVDKCKQPETVYICRGNDVTLTAGEGYESYTWTINGSVINNDLDGTIRADQNSIRINQAGNYKVEEIAPASKNCIDRELNFNVQFDSEATDPFDERYPQSRRDNKTTCIGDPLAYVSEFYLCGKNNGRSSRTIDLRNVYAGIETRVQWFKLACSDPSKDVKGDCATTILPSGCNWTDITPSVNPKNITISDEGQYKVIVTLGGKCPREFFFNVYQSPLVPKTEARDILCNNDGYIKITSVSNTYQSRLLRKNTTTGNFEEVSTWAQITSESVTYDIDVDGTYQYEVKLADPRARGCTFISDEIPITKRTLTIPPPTLSKIVCSTDTEGTIRVNAKGVGGRVEYQLFESTNTTSTPDQTDTEANTNLPVTFTVDPTKEYKVVVIVDVDPNDSSIKCTETVEGLKFNIPKPLVFNAVKQKDITCLDGNSPGLIKLSASGGTPNPGSSFTYSIIKYNGTVVNQRINPSDIDVNGNYQVPNGKEGTYTFKVEYNNCSATSDAEVKVIPPLTFTVEKTDASCTSGGKGSIRVKTNEAFTGSIEYSLVATNSANNVAFSPLNVGSNVSFKGLAPDTYTVVIRTTDNNNYQCNYTLDKNKQKIEGSIAVTGATVKSKKGITCSVPLNGSITFTKPTSGSGTSFEYILVNGTFRKTKTSSNNEVTVDDLIAGTYQITIKDQDGCTQTFQETIEGLPTTPTVVVSTPSYGCDGAASFNVTPVVDGYVYTLTATGFTTQTVTATSSTTAVNFTVPAGVKTYNLEVNYGRGCVTPSIEVNIEGNKEFRAGLQLKQDVKCKGSDTGIVELTVENFNTSTGFWYTDALGNWQASGVSPTLPIEITGFKAGTATVEVRYTENDDTCKQTVTQGIGEPINSLSVKADASKIRCSSTGHTTSTITLEITGGTKDSSNKYPTIRVRKETAPGSGVFGPPTNVLTGKDAGLYQVEVIDANNCPATTTVSIKEPSKINITLNGTKCYKKDGQIGIVIAPNTTGPYNFEYSVNGGIFESINPINIAPGKYEIKNLSPAKYTVRVTDNFGCFKEKSVDILKGITFDVDVTDVTCNNGAITIPTASIAGGHGTYQYAIVDPLPTGTLPPSTAFSNVDPLNSTLTITSADITGTSRDYDIFIKDSQDCFSKIPKKVRKIANPTLKLVGVVHPNCSNKAGIIEVNFTGTLDYKLELINTTTGVKTPKTVKGGKSTKFERLEAGVYDVTLKDGNGCDVNPSLKGITLSSIPPLAVKTQFFTPSGCTKYDSSTEKDYGVQFINLPTGYNSPPHNLKLEFTVDNGNTWVTTSRVEKIKPRTLLKLKARYVDGSGNQICIQDIGADIMPLNVTGLVVIATKDSKCEKGVTVKLKAKNGTGPFEFSMDGGLTWVNPNLPIELGDIGPHSRNHEFLNLVPGQEYSFFVKDTKGTATTTDDCTAEDPKKINFTPDVIITGIPRNICFGEPANSTTGGINFTIDDHMNAFGGNPANVNWQLFEKTFDVATNGIVVKPVTGQFGPYNKSGTLSIATGLPKGRYFIRMQIESPNDPTKFCRYASPDIFIDNNTEIKLKIKDEKPITCGQAGIVRITNIEGGDIPYTYTVKGTNLVTGTTLTVQDNKVSVPYAVVDNKTLPVIITIEAQDRNQCSDPDTATLVVSQPPTIASITTDSCSDNNKSITVNITPSTPVASPYTYGYSTDNGATYTEVKNINANKYTFGGLSDSGTYKIRVTDANGCSVVSTNRTVIPLPAGEVYDAVLFDNIGFNVVVTKASCLKDKSEIMIRDLKGSGEYSYTVALVATPGTPIKSGIISAPQTTAKIPVSTNKDYIVTVKDEQSECSLPKNRPVRDPASPSFTHKIVTSKCSDDTTTITLDNIGLTYTVNPMLGVTVKDNVVTIVNPNRSTPFSGSYTITGTDGNTGCSTALPNIPVSITSDISVPTAVATQFSCPLSPSSNKENSASISVTAVSGNFVEGGTGTYTKAQLIKVVGGVEEVISTTATISDPITFSIANTSGAAGSYFVRVYDNNGCHGDSAPDTIDAFVPLTKLSIERVLDTDCNGNERIKVSYAPVSGTTLVVRGDDNTVISPVASTTDEFILSNTNAPYSITLTNTKTRCKLVKTHTPKEEPKFKLDVAPTPVACFGESTGSITFNFNAATPYLDKTNAGYTFRVLQGGSQVGTNVGTNQVTGLAAATNYTLEVVMNAYPSCTVTKPFKIIQPNKALAFDKAEVKPIQCFNESNGSLEFLATGGWGDYEYQVEKVSNATGSTVESVIQPFGTNTKISNSLAVGFYRITVRDAKKCSNVSVIREVEDKTRVDFTLGINENSCTVTDPAVITVTPNSATGTGTGFRFWLYDSSNNELIRNQVSNEFKRNVPGLYKVRVSDSNGCFSAFQDAPINVNGKLAYKVEQTKPVTCKDEGEITITVTSGSGSYTFAVAGVPASDITINGTGTVATFAVPADSSPTTYNVTVTDTGATPNCSRPDRITTAAKELPSFTHKVVTSKCSDDTTTITLDNTNLTYSINSISGARATVNGNVITIVNDVTSTPFSGSYTITGTDGNTGCSTALPNIPVSITSDISVPTAVATQFACTTGNKENSASISVTAVGGNFVAGGTGTYTKAQLIKVVGGVEQVISTTTTISDPITFNIANTPTAAGSYFVRVYDNNGCHGDSAPDTINAFVPLTKLSIERVLDTDCNGNERIKVSYAPVSGTTLEVRGNDNTVISPVASTTDEFIVSDTNAPYRIVLTNTTTGCELVETHTPKGQPKFKLDITSTEDVKCKGDSNGTMTFDFNVNTKYSSTYTFTVLDISGNILASGNDSSSNPKEATGLPAGKHTLQLVMTDYPECTVTEPFTIKEPKVDLAITNLNLKLVGCDVTNSGGVVIDVEGGWGNYRYYVENADTGKVYSNYEKNNDVRDLIAGNYIVKVRDGDNTNDCEVVDRFRLLPPEPIAADTRVVINDCEGESEATIIVSNVRGGQGVLPRLYKYILEYPDGTKTIAQDANLPAGHQFTGLKATETGKSYKVYIIDGGTYQCKIQSPISVPVIDPSKVVAKAVASPVNCNNDNVTVTVSASGGDSSSYTFSSDGVNYQSSPTFSVAPKDTPYYFYAKDAKNCASNPYPITIDPILELKVELEVVQGYVTCKDESNGILKANTNDGGFGNYRYHLLDADNGDNVLKSQDNATFKGLAPGNYKIRVTSQDCTATTGAHRITEPEELLADYRVDNETCVDANDGRITIFNERGGTGNYKYYIDSDPVGKVRDKGVFEGLEPGFYTVTVFDGRGCPKFLRDIEVKEAILVEVKVINIVQQNCSSDPTPSFELEIKGGVAPYSTSINNGPYVEGRTIFDASQGIEGGKNYTIFVKDAVCDKPQRVRVELVAPVQIKLTVEPVVYDCDNVASIKATVEDPYKAEVDYILFGIDANNPTDVSSYVEIERNASGEFRNMPADSYVVRAVHRTKGCKDDSNPFVVESITESLSFTVDDSEKNKLIVTAIGGLPPYEFSFDGGVTFSTNNTLIITQTRDYEIVVRDRRTTEENEGCPVKKIVRGEYITIKIPNFFTPDGDGKNDYWYPYDVEDYHDVRVEIFDRYARKITEFKGYQQGWDGIYQGNPLPTGDYWYTIYYKELSGEEKEIMGHFTLYRK